MKKARWTERAQDSGTPKSIAHPTPDNESLATALEQADMRSIIADFYPETNVRTNVHSQRINAPWRGGDNPNVVILTREKAHDFKTGETWNAWTFLTKVVGLSSQQAAEYLLYQAGLSSQPYKRKAARVQAKQISAQEKQQDARKAAKLKEAHRLHKALSGNELLSAYLDRKQVAPALETHTVNAVRGSDSRGNGYVQFAIQNFESEITSFQRIYDDKVLGDRDKDFIGPNKGSFVLILPKEIKALPRSSSGLIKYLLQSYEIGICEGVATGLSVVMAKPKTIMFCALYAGNLAPVARGLRKRYGSSIKYATERGSGDAKKAVKITIWADNDAWTESGNTGLTKAHEAALHYACQVRTPRFDHRTLDGAKPTDFNDLHTMFGLEAVRRSRIEKPDTRLVFKKELAKRAAYEHQDRYLPPIGELPPEPSALLIKSPMETGKTQALIPVCQRHLDAGRNILVLTHRESLAEALASRLGLENYQDYNAFDLALINKGLVICFDSLHKLALHKALPHFDLLIIDESEQVMRHVTGTHIKHKEQNIKVLAHYLEAVPRIIALDAHLGPVTQRALKLYAPDKTRHWHKNHYAIGQGREVTLLHDRHEAIDAFIKDRKDGTPVWYACDSIKHTRDLSEYVRAAGEQLVINSETATTEPVKRFSVDPTRSAPDYAAIIASPSVQTGLSDDSHHWQRVIGNFTGLVGTPTDMAQALLRARAVKDLSVYVSPQRRESKTAAEYKAEVHAANEAEAERLGRQYGTLDPNYLELKAAVVESESIQTANAKFQLIKEMTLLGYDVIPEGPRDQSSAELERIGKMYGDMRELGLLRYIKDRVSAARISKEHARAYEQAQRLTQQQQFELERYQVEDFYCASGDNDELAELLRRDNYGKLRRQIVRYETAFKPLQLVEHEAHQAEGERGLHGDNRSLMLRYEFTRQLSEVVGLNEAAEATAAQFAQERDALQAKIEQLQAQYEAERNTVAKGRINGELRALRGQLQALRDRLEHTYTAQTVKPFIDWCIKHHKALSNELKKDIPKEVGKLKAQPLSYVSSFLRSMGLKQTCVTRNKDQGNTYSLTLTSIGDMWGLSRPRRAKWDAVQISLYKNPIKENLHTTRETPSETAKTSRPENVREGPPPAAPPGDGFTVEDIDLLERFTRLSGEPLLALRQYIDRPTEDKLQIYPRIVEYYGISIGHVATRN